MAYKKKKRQVDVETRDQSLIELWRGRIKDYENKARNFLEEGKEAWAERLNGKVDDDIETKRGDRAYTHVSRFIESSYYSRKPRVIGSGDFDRKDSEAATAAYIAERLGKRFVDDNRFSSSIKGARGDFTHTSRGVTRVYIDTIWADVDVEVPVYQQEIMPEPQLDPETGMAMPPEPQIVYVFEDGSMPDPKLEIKQGEEGFYVIVGKKELKTACPYLMHVDFKDYGHNPDAKTREMLSYEYYRLCLSKEEIKKRWPSKYAEIREIAESSKRKGESGLFEVYECWSKDEETVTYLYLKGEGLVLEAKAEDPLKLSGFFPSVGPIISDKLTDKLWGVSDYITYKDKLDYLKGLDKRRKYLSTLLRRNGIGDGKHRDTLDPLNKNQRDGDIIFVDNFRDLVTDSQNSDSLIKFFPVKEYVDAFAETNESYFTVKQEYYEYFGLEKLLQAAGPGQSQVSEEDIVASLGLLYTTRIREFQEFVQENIRSLIDAAIYVLPEPVFKQLIGYEFLPEKMKQNYGRAYEILQSDFNRTIRIDIDTDSTVATSQAQEAEANMQLFQTVTQSLGPLTDIAQTKPEFIAPLATVVYAAISKMQGGKAASDELAGAFSALVEQAMQPPPVDEGPNIEEQKLAIDGMLAEHKVSIENREQSFREFIEQEKQRLAEQKAQLDAQERFMEEKRLSDRQQQDMLGMIMDLKTKIRDAELKAKSQALTAMAQANNQPPAPAPEKPDNTVAIVSALAGVLQSLPQPQINVQAPKPTKRIGTIQRNGDTARIVVEEEESENEEEGFEEDDE